MVHQWLVTQYNRIIKGEYVMIHSAVDKQLYICSSPRGGDVIILVSWIGVQNEGEGTVIYSTNEGYEAGYHDKLWPMHLFDVYDDGIFLKNID
jgi:hypothetical protein